MAEDVRASNPGAARAAVADISVNVARCDSGIENAEIGVHNVN